MSDTKDVKDEARALLLSEWGSCPTFFFRRRVSGSALGEYDAHRER
jgi:hypothetical protein